MAISALIKTNFRFPPEKPSFRTFRDESITAPEYERDRLSFQPDGGGIRTRSNSDVSVNSRPALRSGCQREMLLRKFPQLFRGEFWRHIALRRCQQFVAHHELPDGRGAQQGREKVCVKMPLRMIFAVRRALVKTHRIRENGLEQVVVTRR